MSMANYVQGVGGYCTSLIGGEGNDCLPLSEPMQAVQLEMNCSLWWSIPGHHTLSLHLWFSGFRSAAHVRVAECFAAVMPR